MDTRIKLPILKSPTVAGVAVLAGTATVALAVPHGPAAAQESVDARTVGIEWPAEGSVSAVFATLPPGAPRAAPGIAWPPANSAEAWAADGGPFGAWARALAAEAGAEVPDATRRERLALTALGQGRHGDAWRHAAAAARADADVARALVARLIPGAPAGTAVDGDGRLVPLPNGIVLQPSLPPPTDPAPGRLDVRELTLVGLRIGDAELDLRLGVRGDGVELRFEHVSGGPVEFSVAVPCPTGFRTRVEYANWSKLATVGEPIPVQLRAGDEPTRIWARTELASTPWPATLPDALDARVRSAGLVLEIDRDDPERAPLAALAGALGALLDVPCTLADERRRPARAPLSPLRIHLPADVERPTRVAALCGAVERFVLGPP